MLTLTVSGIFHGHMNEPLGVSTSGWLNGLRAGVRGANDVVGALAILRVVGARLGGSPVTRAVMRIVIGGAAALATTFAIGSLLGTSGIPWPMAGVDPMAVRFRWPISGQGGHTFTSSWSPVEITNS